MEGAAAWGKTSLLCSPIPSVMATASADHQPGQHSGTSPFRSGGRRGLGAGKEDASMPSQNTVWLDMVAAGGSWLLQSMELLIKNNELKRTQWLSVCLYREYILPSIEKSSSPYESFSPHSWHVAQAPLISPDSTERSWGASRQVLFRKGEMERAWVARAEGSRMNH